MNLKKIETDEKQIASLAAGAGAAGWSGFVAIYRPAMVDYVEGYLCRRGISRLDAEGIVQDVLLRLVKRMGDFRYDRARGRFRDFLGKMLLATTVDAIRKDISIHRAKECFASELQTASSGQTELDAWHDALFGRALKKVLADTSISKQTRDVFKRYALDGENAERVAQAFGLKVNAVYQIKSRLTERLKDEVQAIEKVTPFTK